MNIYTVGAATQGLSNYLNKNFKDLKQIAVVVGHDCRNNSRLFAEVSANIFAANGIKVSLFDDMRPTPEMSFAIRQLGCQSGIILRLPTIRKNTTVTRLTGTTVPRYWLPTTRVSSTR